MMLRIRRSSQRWEAGRTANRQLEERSMGMMLLSSCSIPAVSFPIAQSTGKERAWPLPEMHVHVVSGDNDRGAALEGKHGKPGRAQSIAAMRALRRCARYRASPARHSKCAVISPISHLLLVFVLTCT
jgi:hypothetical protein